MRVGDLREVQPDRLFEPRYLTALEVFDAADAPVGRGEECGAVLYWVARLREGDEPPLTAALHGRIVRLPEGEGIAGVTVTAEPGGLRRVTNARGRASTSVTCRPRATGSRPRFRTGERIGPSCRCAPVRKGKS